MQHDSEVDFLMEHGHAEAIPCSGEQKDGYGRNSLLRAANANNWREERKFILDKVDPSAVDGQGLTAMHYAAMDGSMELARILLELGLASLILCESPGGETSLWVACTNGHLDVAKLLSEAGGESLLFKTNENGPSCLHIILRL